MILVLKFYPNILMMHLHDQNKKHSSRMRTACLLTGKGEKVLCRVEVP